MSIAIKWNKKVIKKFDEAIERIGLDSQINAEKVRNEILLTADSLSKYPEKYNPDKYKTENDGSFRAFELHHYRISYRYIKAEIRIMRMRHTKMNPLAY